MNETISFSEACKHLDQAVETAIAALQDDTEPTAFTQGIDHLKWKLQRILQRIQDVDDVATRARAIKKTMTSMPKHPNIKVDLVGKDGNAYAILGRCKIAARIAKLPQPEISAFLKEAMSGDYDHLLKTCCAWFTCR